MTTPPNIIDRLQALQRQDPDNDWKWQVHDMLPAVIAHLLSLDAKVREAEEAIETAIVNLGTFPPGSLQRPAYVQATLQIALHRLRQPSPSAS